MKWYQRLSGRQAKYREVFGSDSGKWVLADLLKTCGYGQDPHTPGDPHTTAYLVGRSFAPLHIRTVLDMSDDEIGRMVKQYEEAEQRKDEGIFET